MKIDYYAFRYTLLPLKWYRWILVSNMRKCLYEVNKADYKIGYIMWLFFVRPCMHRKKIGKNKTIVTDYLWVIEFCIFLFISEQWNVYFLLCASIHLQLFLWTYYLPRQNKCHLSIKLIIFVNDDIYKCRKILLSELCYH